MAPTLYSCLLSPPVRSVLLTAKAIGLQLNIVDVDLGKKEQMAQEFLKMNPQHTVPTLKDDNGFIIWDSHAIMSYIVEKYSDKDQFYPKELEIRANIHQRMHFDTMSAVTRSKAINPLFHEGAKSIRKDLVEEIKTQYDILENILEKSDWIACNQVTIADFCLVTSFKTSDIVVPVNGRTHPKLLSWLTKSEDWPFYDENRTGHDELKKLILERLIP